MFIRELNPIISSVLKLGGSKFDFTSINESDNRVVYSNVKLYDQNV